MDRRSFLQSVGAITLFAACGKSKDIIPEEVDNTVLFRFALASDVHFGEAETDYINHINAVKSGFTAFQKNNPCSFFVLNGDIIHNDPKFLEPAYEAVKGLHEKLYVTQGNHDRVSDAVWKATWGHDLDFDVSYGEYGFIFGTTSDSVGTLSCPNLVKLKTMLDKHKQKRHVFIFWHIHPHGSMQCTGVKELLAEYPNVCAVFNGHDHNDESIHTVANIPYMFNGRVAGSWGSFDRNFRVVEITKNTVVTYLMTPHSKKKQTTLNV